MSITNKIGIGTVQFGLDYGISNQTGKTLPAEVASILNYARSVGVQYIDTANAYGESESVLGAYGAADSFKIVSKFMPSETDRSVRQQFELSCKKLKTEELYAYLAHRPLALIDNKEDWDTVRTLKVQSKIQKIGFSLNDPKELEALVAEGLIPDLVQVPYNYFDKRFEPLIIELKKKGCEIHTRSTFLQGLFFSGVSALPVFFDEAKEVIKSLQDCYGQDLSKVLLKYVLSQPFIDLVVIGIENVKQLKDNIDRVEQMPDIPQLQVTFSERIITPSRWNQTQK